MPKTVDAERLAEDDMDRMVQIATLITELRGILERFGNTCVYIRRGGLSWGAVALNRRDDDAKNGVFDQQAQHDRDMQQRAEQVERLITSRDAAIREAETHEVLRDAGLNPNVSRVRSNYVEYFDNILRSGHGSVLEHAVYSYAIEGVSRVFTAEMNRHRAGWAISEGSLRFIRFDKDIPYWIPLSLRDSPDDDKDLRARKQYSRAQFHHVFDVVEQSYSQLLDAWDMHEGDKNFDYKKKVTSCLRRIVPLGVATGGVWTGNIRALRHVLALRTDPSAEEEIAHVFSHIGDDIVKREPMLFQDFEEMVWTNGHTSRRPKYRKV